MGIWQDLVGSHGFARGYESLKRFVRSLRGASSPEARVITRYSSPFTSEVFRQCEVPSAEFSSLPRAA